MKAIETRAEAVTEVHFGQQVSDPYRWLEQEESPEVQAWMKQQAERSATYLSALPERAALLERAKEVLYVDHRSVPVQRGDRVFYTQKAAKVEKSVYFWQTGDAAPRVLLDPNEMSTDGSLSVRDVVPSWDGDWVVYAEHENAADAATLRLMNVESGTVEAGDSIYKQRFAGVSWLPDGSGFFYTWRPSEPEVPAAEQNAFAEVRLHRLGTSPGEDTRIYPATGDASRFISAHVTESGRYVFVYISHGWSRNDVYFKRLDREDEFRPLIKDQDALFEVIEFRDRFYILTNLEAPRFRLMETAASKPELSQWSELLPQSSDAVLESVQVVGGRFVVKRLRNAYSQLELRDLRGNLQRPINLPGVGTVHSLSGRQESPELYYQFSSFTVPNQTFRTELNTGDQKLLHRVEVPADVSQFTVSQEWAQSKDGTRIPFFVIRSAATTGIAPTIINAYGGFNISKVPSFSSALLPWLERGGVYIVANLRGGGEFGEDWHRAGMLHNKQNVFDDLFAVTERSFQLGITRASQVAISGGSNGGLLVGAAMTQRPELFAAVSCGVPLLDMVRYPLFGLGKAWIPEYGDPSVEEDFRALYAYSPYHNITSKTRYPTLLMLSADTDDRVDPMHARKFVAAIQAESARELPRALLRIETNAGHGGADLRSKYAERLADEYAFLLSELSGNR